MGVDPVSLGMMAVGTLGSALGGGGGSQSVNQQPMMTEEQKRAMKLLQGVADTGQYNGMTFGEQYGGSLGNYDMTGLERMGQSNLAKLMQAGTGQNKMTESGQNVMHQLLTTDMYNPMSGGAYDAYKKQARMALQDDMDALNRSLGSSGNLYSTARIGENRRLVEGSNAALQSKLGDMWQNYTNQKLGMAPTAYNAGMQGIQQGENIAMNRIGASQQYGGLSRNLTNARETAAYNEWVRARAEKSQPLQYAGQVMGANANFQPTSYPTTSPWQGLFGTMADMGGQMFMKSYKA